MAGMSEVIFAFYGIGPFELAVAFLIAVVLALGMLRHDPRP